jgi:hypothetical protein
MFEIAQFVFQSAGTLEHISHELILTLILVLQFASAGMLFVQGCALAVRTLINRDKAKYWRGFLAGLFFLILFGVLEAEFIRGIT